jgi:hypothetical protein
MKLLLCHARFWQVNCSCQKGDACGNQVTSHKCRMTLRIQRACHTETQQTGLYGSPPDLWVTSVLGWGGLMGKVTRVWRPNSKLDAPQFPVGGGGNPPHGLLFWRGYTAWSHYPTPDAKNKVTGKNRFLIKLSRKIILTHRSTKQLYGLQPYVLNRYVAVLSTIRGITRDASIHFCDVPERKGKSLNVALQKYK